jgi:hypothetical protein
MFKRLFQQTLQNNLQQPASAERYSRNHTNMATDEEAARRLHLEMNGFAQRRRGAPTDLSKLAPVRASLRNGSPSTDVQMSEAETGRRGERLGR